MKTDEHENLTSRHLVHMWLPSTKAQRGMAIFPLHLVTNIVGIHLDHQTVGDTCYDMTLSMLWHLLWYSTQHGMALSMAWHSASYRTQHGMALCMAWHSAWYGIYPYSHILHSAGWLCGAVLGSGLGGGKNGLSLRQSPTD